MKPLLTMPAITIEANGTALAATDLHALSAVLVQQRLSLPTLCELTFQATTGPLASVEQLLPGANLRLTIAGQAEPLFVGQVTALEYCYTPNRGQEIRVRGYDSLHQLRKRQSVRAHVHVTTQDLAHDLVADLGLTVQATEPGPLWSQLIQHRQSDFELLQACAETSGLYLTVRGNVLHLITLQGIGEAVPLALSETLLEARMEINAESLYRTITAAGWNSAHMETYTSHVSQARVGRTVATELTPARVGGSGTRALIDENCLSEAHAAGLAQAELDARVAREITLWGVAEGATRLRPGAPVTVTGVADTMAGRYVLTSCTHTIDAQRGYLTELASTPPPPRQRAYGSVGVPGVVSQIDDPDHLGRVRVTLPTYGDLETDWIPILSAGAGTNKGFMIFPAKGDHVLVLLAHEDPGQGVVLGNFYTPEKPPDTGIANGTVERYTILTPGGQRVRLDDGQKAIRLENSDGSYCELAPHKVLLHAATDLEIAAPGQRIVIRGKNIDFERG